LIRTSEQTISNIEDQHALPVTDDGPSNAASGEGAAESGKNEITLVQGFVFRGRCSLGGFLHDNPAAVVVPEGVSGSSSATATATGCRRRVPGPWSRAFPSCARAEIR